MTESLFPDEDLVSHTAEKHGDEMAVRLQLILELDPMRVSGFANSIRRTLTNEIDREAQRG